MHVFPEDRKFMTAKVGRGACGIFAGAKRGLFNNCRRPFAFPTGLVCVLYFGPFWSWKPPFCRVTVKEKSSKLFRPTNCCFLLPLCSPLSHELFPYKQKTETGALILSFSSGFPLFFRPLFPCTTNNLFPEKRPKNKGSRPVTRLKARNAGKLADPSLHY